MAIIIAILIIVAVILFGRYFVVPRLPKIADWLDDLLNKDNKDEDNPLY